MESRTTGRFRPRVGYSSPSTIQHSQQRMKRFILLKQQAEVARKSSLSVSNLPSIDIPPKSRTLSIAKQTTLSIPTSHLPVLSPRNTNPTRPQAKARRRLPPTMASPVTHCCVCWQKFTERSPEFHCICGSIPCLDCLGYHTCPS